MNQYRNACTVFAALLLASCGGGSAESTTPADGPPTKANSLTDEAAMAVFNMRCMTCHGLTGHGDGPGAAQLNPKPRSFSDVAWQDSVTDDHIKKTITYGGAAVGKSAIMPAQPDLKGDDATLSGLVKIVRSWRGK